MDTNEGNILSVRTLAGKCVVAETYHEGLKVRAVPLRDTIANLPIVVDAVRVVELAGGRSKAFVKTAFKAFDIIFTGLQVVSRSDQYRIRARI